MKIILISAVAKLGKIGDVLEVKNGYAKNYLIPSKKAICYNANNFKFFESKKQEFEQANKDSLESAKKLQDQLIGKDIVIIENASDDGRLYGSVNSAVIATKINQLVKEANLSRLEVTLDKPIKEIGVYKVSLELHLEVDFVVRVIVTRSESEIKTLLKAQKDKEAAAQKQEVAVASKAPKADQKPAEEQEVEA